jgi:hypothetical protein
MKVWIGRVLSALAALFLVMDAVMKVARTAPSVEGTLALGFPDESVVGIGVLLLVCVALYLVPRTALIGAVAVTGYLGGAVAAHVRMGNPLFSHTLFPLYVAAMIWGGLALRDARVRVLLAPTPASTR